MTGKTHSTTSRMAMVAVLLICLLCLCALCVSSSHDADEKKTHNEMMPMEFRHHHHDGDDDEDFVSYASIHSTALQQGSTVGKRGLGRAIKKILTKIGIARPCDEDEHGNTPGHFEKALIREFGATTFPNPEGDNNNKKKKQPILGCLPWPLNFICI